MSFRFVKENEDKILNTDSLDLNNQDDFVIRKSTFQENPDTFPKKRQELGEDFLIQKDDLEPDEEDEEEEEDEEYKEDNNVFMRETENYEEEKLSHEEIQQQKSHYLYQLNRMRKRGIETSRRFGMEHSLDEIRGEVFRLKREIDMDNSIDYCRQGLMFCVSTIEMLNGQYNLGGKLNGWSQVVMGNIESYDDVFEELYEKYYSSVKMAPEIKLISMVAGSAFMFHLQKSLLNNETFAPRQREMTGPELDIDGLIGELNEGVDLDDISSVTSSEKSIKIIVEDDKKTIPIKKRGRPKKKT